MRIHSTAASAALAIACLCGVSGCDRTSAGTAGQGGSGSAGGDVQLPDSAAPRAGETTSKAGGTATVPPESSAVMATPLYLPTLGTTISIPSVTPPRIGAGAMTDTNAVTPGALPGTDSSHSASGALSRPGSTFVNHGGATSSVLRPKIQ